MSIFFFVKVNDSANYSFLQFCHLAVALPIFPSGQGVTDAAVYKTLAVKEVGHRALDALSNVFNFHKGIISQF